MGALKGDIEQVGQREVIARLESSLSRAREGDEGLREAFKRLRVDIADEDVEGEALLTQVLRAGSRLDKAEQDELHRALIGDFEKLG
jgi:hypothetical protein